MPGDARFFTRFVLTGFAIFLCSSLVAEAASESTPRYGGEYRAPLTSEPETLDPALYTNIYSMQVANNLFDGLVRFDDVLKVVPAIASFWKISRDQRTYTFTLRKGVRFHNGREVTAGDFVFSFSRILDSKTQSPVASFFMNILGAKDYYEGKSETVSGLRVPQPYTLQIELEEPFAPFLPILGMVNAKVVPKEAIGPEFADHPIGTGPFRFRSWQPGKEIVLAANEDYFDGRPYLDSLLFRIYPNIEFEKIFADFQRGLLEHAFIPSSAYDRILANPDSVVTYKIISQPGLNIVYVGMNMRVLPLDDLRVRQAISYAVDTKTIVREITRRGSIPAEGILPPGIAGYDPNLRGYDYDPQRARELLVQAGYPEGRGFPILKLWTISKAESVQKELQAYQHYLAEIGIKVEIKIAENWKAFVAAIMDKKADLFYAAWYADYPDPDNFFYPLVHSESESNLTGFNNFEVERMLDQARAELDYHTRVEAYQRIERKVMEQAPLISQHTERYSYLFQPQAHNVLLSRLGAFYLPFRQIWLEQ